MLHPRRVAGSVGAITRLFSLTFLLPALAAWFYDANRLTTSLVFVSCAGGVYLLGAALERLGDGSNDLGNREAYLSVGLGWILLCLLAAVPFVVTGTLRNPVDALFETMSGLTTTGASVIPVLEEVDPSVHVWRATLQFLGGMGIIVLSVAVLSRLSQGGLQMLQAEVPGPTFHRSTPRLIHAVRTLWRLYLGIAATFFVAMLGLLMGRHNMGLKEAIYESLIHTFATVSTGGFSNHSESIAFFHDPIVELLVIGGMLIAGTNFALLLLVKQGHWRRLVQDAEWRLYAGNFMLVTMAITLVLMRAGAGFLEALRDSGFVVASMMTSTGFATADYNVWPAATHLLILFIMVGGGMASSTSGGVKLARILLLLKAVGRHFRTLLHPRAVLPLRMNGKVVQDRTLMTAAAFFISFLGLWLLGTLALELTDPAFRDATAAASASLSALSNIGPGLGVVGPTENFADLSVGSKLVLAAEMWFGRLEIFTAVLVFLPETWRNYRN
ncbi:MAG: TrkH family potassium uptake protein [Thermoplasmatota archaeon]